MKIKKSGRSLTKAAAVMEEGTMSAIVEGRPSTAVVQEAFVPALVMNPAAFDGESEEALALRHARKPRLRQNLTLEFTRDPALIHQYFQIYEREFGEVQNAKRYVHITDDHDRRAEFLIVRQGKFCIGGARLSTKSPRQPHLLPIESDSFRIENYFPFLASKEKTYGQIGRLCLLPQYRDGDITSCMFWHMNRKAAALGWEMGFATAPILSARNISKLCRHWNIDTKIYFDVEIPPYPMCEEIKMYFMSIGVNRTLATAVPPVISLKEQFKENAEA